MTPQSKYLKALKELEGMREKLDPRIIDGITYFASYDDLYKYVKKLTKALVNALKEMEVGEVMTLEMAEEIIRPLLKAHSEKVIDAAFSVQKGLNELNGIGLEAVRATQSKDKVDGIIKAVCTGNYEDTSWVLDSGVTAYAMSLVDDTCRLNAEQQYKAGLAPVVERRVVGETCKWCRERAGVWVYPDVPDGVYQRHRGCDCIVEYRDGKMKQNVHTKKWENLRPSEIVTKPSASLTSRQAQDYENYLKQKRKEDAINQIAITRGISYDEAKREHHLAQERIRDRARYRAGRRK